jgi:chitinase
MNKILDEPIKPTVQVTWYFSNEKDGKRGRCGRGVQLINETTIPTCNPDDLNAHCCSNGGFCGTGKDFCECKQCIDFAKNPNYMFLKKAWWEYSDGADKVGRCGPDAPKINGQVAQCNPESDSYCCSKYGSCGSGKNYCDCESCINYKYIYQFLGLLKSN